MPDIMISGGVIAIMKPYLLSMIGFISFFVSGCGSDGGAGSDSRELQQGIDLVIYDLDRAELNVEVEYSSGTNEEIRRVLNYETDGSKDDMRKVLDHDRFVLVINDQHVSVDIDPEDGSIDYEEQLRQDADGCRIEGRSKLSGKATHLKFELNWEFTGELQGDRCTDLNKAKFSNFRMEEVDKLNIHSVRDLLNSLDDDLEDSRKIKLRLKIIGETDG